MFILLLLVTFIIAAVVSFGVARFFDGPISSILNRFVAEVLSTAWHRYIKFDIYIVGISGVVRIWELEKYITAVEADTEIVTLNVERWILEIYRTVISTLESIAWMLLVFFVFSLIAFVVVRGFELKYKAGQDKA